jgi:hypothetical protein
MQPVTAESVLFITLDSCRHDSFAAATLPALRAIAPLHRAQSPCHFTYGAHAAMFVGFTPGIPGLDTPVLNPKAGRLFRLRGGGGPGRHEAAFILDGETIIDGFRQAGYRTIGAGAVGWFDPATPPGQRLTAHFDDYIFTGPVDLADQCAFVTAKLDAVTGDAFTFINIGETHVPYWYRGAPWHWQDNPCIPFQTIDRADECRTRQIACLEYADRLLAPLIERFMGATILICGDHGDAWGEDGLWEHGFSHWTTLTVPLLARVRGVPVTPADDPGR